MVESDSAEGEMAESSSLMWKSRNLLATASHKGLEIVIDQLSMSHETIEFQSARELFEFCADQFPNCITLMLLKVYRYSTNGVVRSRSIYLLSQVLVDLRSRDVALNVIALHEIKPFLISCLEWGETKEPDIRNLGRIVSNIAFDVIISGNEAWDELSDCIFRLSDSDPIKAFHIFVDFPPLYAKFINSFMDKLLERAYKVLLTPLQNRAGDWILAFKTCVKMGMQILEAEIKFDVLKHIFPVLVKSVNDLVEKGMKQLLQQGFQDLEKFLLREDHLYKYNDQQRLCVASLAYRLKETGPYTVEVMMIINRLVKYNKIQSSKLNPSLIQPKEANQDHGGEIDPDWLNHLKMLTPVELLRISASPDLQEGSREMAIRRLNDLLTDHTLKKVAIETSMIRELHPVLLSCLWEEGISEGMFKLLGQVLYHVANELFSFQIDTWEGLTNYVKSKSKTDFERAVYIFQSLPMPLEDDDIVNPMIETLLPEICSKLNPPEEVLVDNSSWVLAFTGAFSAMIHLIEGKSHAIVKEVTYKMIESVKDLVERGMEVGFVKRAFRDVESLVKKNVKWYGTSQFKFAKGLFWKLCEIKGMKMGTRMVIWRTNLILEQGVVDQEKELPKNDLDWLGQ